MMRHMDEVTTVAAPNTLYKDGTAPRKIYSRKNAKITWNVWAMHTGPAGPFCKANVIRVTYISEARPIKPMMNKSWWQGRV